MDDKSGRVERVAGPNSAGGKSSRGSHRSGSKRGSDAHEEDIIRFRRSQDHHERFIQLIGWELDDEMHQVELRLSSWPKARLAAAGLALFNLQARTSGWLFGQRVIRLKGPDSHLPSHRFKQGDIVFMSRFDPLREKPIEAIVERRSRDSVSLVIPEVPKDLRNGVWRLDKAANRVSHDRMRDALNLFFGDDTATPLRDLILGQPHDMVESAARPPGLGGSQRGIEWHLAKDLNEGQRAAAEAALTQRLTLIQGPPGTGKTHTAVRVLQAWASDSGTPILATADSNVAVDNLLEGLLELGVDAVRLGQPVKVREGLRDMTIKARMEQHPLYEDLETVLELNEKLQRRLPGMKGKERGLGHRDLARGWKELRRIERQIRDDILDRAAVICATCIGSGHNLLAGRRFTRILIDEATQGVEPTALVPVSMGCRQLVLVGDHRQLPPTVVSRRAEKANFALSLFERLTLVGLKPHMLETQYRMHPAISAFPSQWFYDGRLKDAVDAADRPAPAGFIWPNWDKPLAFIPVEGGEATSEDGASKENPTEAGWVVRIVEMLVNGGDILPADIGVITPYNGQVRAIGDLIESAGGRSAGEPFDGLEIRSVDGYQGREKEVIVLSTVRSNLDGNIGFLDDPRRLNVAITRAKRGLIVIGDARTMEHQRDWHAWLEHTRVNGLEAWHILQM